MRASNGQHGNGRTGNALVDSEHRYRRLFEAAKDGILILDAETGQITEANPLLQAMLGYPLAELLGKKLWEIGPFKDIVASRQAFQRLQANEYVRYDHLPRHLRLGRGAGWFAQKGLPISGMSAIPWRCVGSSGVDGRPGRE